ncbi:helix-turn-helix domain-containing protein [Mesorhizobium sp. ORS 3428]|uniref:helix-turn-helix domain-containing protein n=1 Tax=Mesorhizobium sp. ORS 3428 TaxID=540997 RepID=UPI000D5282CC
MRYFDDAEYGAAVRRARTEKGLSLRDIATAFGVRLALVSYVERGGEPTPEFEAAAKSKLKIDRNQFCTDVRGNPIIAANQNQD